MARLRVDFFAESLGLGTAMTVLLPQPARSQIGIGSSGSDGPPPVLYLLHGLSDDDTAWTRYTSIERYAANLGLAVVMPQVHRSFYADETYGLRFWEFLSAELPEIVAGFFRVSQDRDDTFVAGLSMGGYGAFKWALRDPGRFAAAASLSGALAVEELQTEPARRQEFHRVFGGRATTGTDDDVLHLLDKADPARLPQLYLACGTEDFLYPQNVAFQEAAARRGVPLTVDMGPGDHEWSYWDVRIRDVLTWLPLRTAPTPA